ncbi:MAG: hypothetical protein IJF83_10890 [Methanobrevibacter sp.]|nr:hypothetical protein [Methanobrevibacter sp.]
MTNNDVIYKFVEYLDSLRESIELYKGVVTAYEIMKDTTISEEQAEVSNAYLQTIQKEWNKSFLQLLEFGVEWLKNQDGDVE